MQNTTQDSVWNGTYGTMRTELTMCKTKAIPTPPGESQQVTLTGSGVLRSIWGLVFPGAAGLRGDFLRVLRENPDVYKKVRIQIICDDASKPQVDVPLADFLCCGHGNLENINARYIQVNQIPARRWCNTKPYQGAWMIMFPMPFTSSLTLRLVNESPIEVRMLFSATYEEMEHREPPRYFYARFQSTACNKEPISIARISGNDGVYVGTSLFVDGPHIDERWHEALAQFDVDNQGVTMQSTGLEDYFGYAWGFRKAESRDWYGAVHINPRKGPLIHKLKGFNTNGTYCMYRFHVHDPVVFQSKLHFYFKQAPVINRPDPTVRYRAVAYWYGKPV